MQPQYDLQVYQVEGSVLRLNDHVLLFSSPASTSWDDETRHEMTIWASYDNGQNWVKKKVVFFGYSGYSDMTVVGPDTVLLTFARGWTGGPGPSRQWRQRSGLLRRDRHGADQSALVGKRRSLRIRLVFQRKCAGRGRRLPWLGRAGLRALGSTGLGPRVQLECGRPDTWPDRPATPRYS